MLWQMTTEEVKKAKQEMIKWTTKQINDDTFGLVYQVLWQLKVYFERVSR